MNAVVRFLNEQGEAIETCLRAIALHGIYESLFFIRYENDYLLHYI